MPAHRRLPFRTPAAARGFSLIELLVVLAVVTILAVLTGPALQGLLGSSNLRGSANSVIALLDLARQSASTRNLSVNVRIYQDTSRPKDSNGNYPYRILAIVIPRSTSGAASDEFLSQPLLLPGDVIVDSQTTFSTLLNTNTGGSGPQPDSGTESPTAPLAVRNLPYVEFMYLPNGTLHLDPTGNWCLTLLNGSKAASANGNKAPAANFVAVVLDVPTSRARTYQP